MKNPINDMSSQPLDFANLFMSAFGAAGFIALMVYYCHRLYPRLDCTKIRRILPFVLDDTDAHQIEIPRVTFQVDAAEISSSDYEDGIYVEAYRDNLVRKPVIVEVELPLKIMDTEEEDTQSVAVAVAVA